MKILSMTASFGCLSRETLIPEPGVNILVRDNEKGKSTWAAFLLAMCYGIDSSERSSRGRIAAKNKYQPWNGEPMEGTMEVLWQGRQIVLQRTSRRGRPMAEFRAYDRETGMDIPELTGENCGKVLLGVEREVFRRTAFLSGEELVVTQDQDLSRRLSNLAASGTAEDSYPAAAQQLKNWKNRCRYHKTGRIPETELRLRQLRETVSDLMELRQRRMETVRELEENQRLQDRLREEERACAEAAQERHRQEVARLEERVRLLRSHTAVLPVPQRLLQMQAQLKMEKKEEQLSPVLPPAVEGCTEEELLPLAQKALEEYERLTRHPASSLWPYYGLTGLLVIGAVAAGIWNMWVLAGAAGILAAASLILLGRERKRCAVQHRQAEEILQAWRVEKREDLLPAAMACRDGLLAVRYAETQRWQRELLLEEIRLFAPEAETSELAMEAISKALEEYRLREAAEQELERARGQRPEQKQTGETDRLQRLQIRAAELRTRGEHLKAQEQALGGLEETEAKTQMLEQEMEGLVAREKALELAQSALEQAQKQLAQGYGPQLTAKAGELMGLLTQGQYDGLVMNTDFSLSLKERATGLLRPLEALSSGTKDQAWLALRLVMTQLLLPKDVPLVLDDALLTFDEERTQCALALLRETGRQILLFSCRPLIG